MMDKKRAKRNNQKNKQAIAPDGWIGGSSLDDRIKSGDGFLHLLCPVCKTKDVFGDEKLIKNGQVLETLTCSNDHYWHETWKRTSTKVFKPQTTKKKGNP